VNKIRRQSGVLVFLTPFLMVALAVVAVLAMDAARLYSVKADMQRVVNAAATAAADSSQACSMDGSLTDMEDRAKAAAKAMGFDPDNPDDPMAKFSVSAGLLSPPLDEPSILQFEERSDILQSNAALVSYTRDEPISKLLPKTLFEPISLSVNAASRKELYASLSATSSTAAVDGGLLGILLDSELLGLGELDLTHLPDLEKVFVLVGDVASVGGEILPLTQVTVADVLKTVLDDVNLSSSPARNVVSALINNAGISGVPVSEVLKIEGDIESARNAKFPLYDFVVSVVMNAAHSLGGEGGGLIDLGIAPIDSTIVQDIKDKASDSVNEVDGITLNVKLVVDEPAPIVIGPARMVPCVSEDDDCEPLQDTKWATSVKAADIRVLVDIGLDLSINYTNVIPKVQLVKVSLPLEVTVGGGKAEFVGTNCAVGNENDVPDLDVNLIGGVVTAHSAQGKALNVSLAGVNIIETGFSVGLTRVTEDGSSYSMENYALDCSGANCVAEFKGAESDYDLDLSFDGPISDEEEWSIGDLIPSVVDIILGIVTNILEPLLDAILAPILSDVVFELLDELGLQVGTMEVRVVGADQLSHQLIENVEIK